jgi:ComF family protein
MQKCDTKIMWTQLNQYVKHALLANSCALCADPVHGDLALCAGCALDLPRNQNCCALCALPLATPTVRCGRCLKKRLLITRIIAPYAYAHPIDSLVLRFKKRGDLACGALLAQLFAQSFRELPNAELPEVLIPVPLHTARLRTRGFDQARLIADALGRQLSCPVQTTLVRTRDTGTQGGLSAAARVRNVARAFFASELNGVAHAALIDDVATTAATLNACALALKRAGVRRVDAWVIARA